MTVAMVKEIQVCGGRIFTNLADVCADYLDCLEQDIDREKINFSVAMPNGQVKHITFRQEDDRIVVYGDFEGLPSFFDYAQEVTGRQVIGREEENEESHPG